MQQQLDTAAQGRYRQQWGLRDNSINIMHNHRATVVAMAADSKTSSNNERVQIKQAFNADAAEKSGYWR